ncbi:MAG TPA: TerC family protein [Methylomirabilota bacterium]|nr:TerC family protein [Methylomirabilota bacterium]
MDQPWVWILFNLFVLAMLAIDLFVFHRTAHEVRAREAAIWSGVWVALGVVFGGGVYAVLGRDAGLEYFTGYVIEKALSVDNIFVFVLIFGYFQVPARYQHRVLFWGIIGALLMRGVLIGAGVYLIQHFHWIIYVFGGFLVLTGLRMALRREHGFMPERNPILGLIRRMVPVTDTYYGQKFFVRRQAGRGFRVVATPLFIVLVFVETTDLIFAVDSIPAIFAITEEPFIIYSSNVFAILGLRAMYFLLAGVIHRFRYLKLGLAVVLVFVGVKMLLADIYEVPIGMSMSVIALALGTATAASLLGRSVDAQARDSVGRQGRSVRHERQTG